MSRLIAEVEEYKNIEEEVHRTISMINGRFSTIDHQPIVYIHRSVSMDELAALYARADPPPRVRVAACHELGVR